METYIIIMKYIMIIELHFNIIDLRCKCWLQFRTISLSILNISNPFHLIVDPLRSSQLQLHSVIN